MKFLRYILILTLLFPRMAVASDNNLKEAFFKSRINDKSIGTRQRIAYMDSLILLSPDDVEIRKLKSDLCFYTGDYANAAIEYMALAGRLSKELVESDRLRAMRYAAASLWHCNRPVEATAITLNLLRLPKSDSMLYYNIMARELAINTAILNNDPNGAGQYIKQQQQEIKDLIGKGLITKANYKAMQGVLLNHLAEYYKLEKKYPAALSEAQKAMNLAQNTVDTVYANVLLADIYARMGENETALTLYSHNLPVPNDPWYNRYYTYDYADLLLKNGNPIKAIEVIMPFDKDTLNDMLEIRRLQIKGRALKAIGNVEGAYRSLLKAQEMTDSLNNMNGMMGAALREFESGLAQDRYDQAMARGDRWRLTTFIIIGAIVLSIAAGGICFFIRKRRRMNINKKEATDTDESRQLVSVALQMSRMSEAINTIGDLASNASPGALEKINTEIKSLDYSANTWEIFRSSFESMHPGFFEALMKDCPGLSIGEQRMAAYIILGLTNKEIASLINRQPRTVETIKYRLRKALQIPTDITTQDYLKRFMPIRPTSDPKS